jgi:hypothetical protein
MMDQADGRGGYHEPILGMVVEGSASGSARPAGGGSMEMPWLRRAEHDYFVIETLVPLN